MAALFACLLAGLSPARAAAPSAGTATHTPLAAGAASQASPTAGTPLMAWDEDQEVTLKGDKLEFRQEDQLLRGQGGVELGAGTMRLHADRLVLDLKSNTLEAEGQVIWADNGNTVYAERVVVNLKTHLGRAEKLLFRRDSWSALGRLAQKESDDEFFLSHCQATSCLRERPHYRIVAGSLSVRMGDRVQARNVRVYVGVVPVFYLPSYSQSLKDPRPPFEIRPGYNKVSGVFLRTAYNYYLGEDNWGSLRFDWMDKLGTGYGMSHHYKLLGGEGEASGYYTRDKNNPDNQSWTGNFKHSQVLGKGLRLLANADFISHYTVNQQYDINRVDPFQTRKFLSLQSGQQAMSWNIDFRETQTLQRRVGQPDPNLRDYVTTERLLPSLGFSRYSRPLVRVGKSAIYLSLTGSFRRAWTVPLTTTAADGSYYDEAAAYFTNTAILVPNLSYSLRLPHLGSLNANVGLNESYISADLKEDPGRGISIATSSLLWRLPIGSVSTDLGYRFGRQLSQMDTLRFAGLTEHRLTFNGIWSPGPDWSLLASTDYDMLPYRSDNNLDRLGLIRGQGIYAPDETQNLMLVAGFNVPTSEFKTVDLSYNLNERRKRWQTGVGLDWVNNRIVQRLSPLDPNAPPSFSFEHPNVTPDQLLVNWRANLRVTDHWSLSGYQRLNLASKAVDEQAFALWRDLHCWDLEFYGRDRIVTGWQFGFTLTLRALPQVSASSNRIVSDLFSDASFGY